MKTYVYTIFYFQWFIWRWSRNTCHAPVMFHESSTMSPLFWRLRCYFGFPLWQCHIYELHTNTPHIHTYTQTPNTPHPTHIHSYTHPHTPPSVSSIYSSVSSSRKRCLSSSNSLQKVSSPSRHSPVAYLQFLHPVPLPPCWQHIIIDSGFLPSLKICLPLIRGKARVWEDSAEKVGSD